MAGTAPPAPSPPLAVPAGAGAGAGLFPFEHAAVERPGPDPVDDPWHRSTSPQARSAYRALGIDWEASWDEVVEVFREQAALWHPDRLAAADPLVQAEGQRRMSDLTRAYRQLQRLLRPVHRELFTS
ncbi:MAG: hypothetical protein H6518_12530 [Microthrixaceae bacterium]|nr:hypothetical protein [Microthrixaceae bacterium]